MSTVNVSFRRREGETSDDLSNGTNVYYTTEINKFTFPPSPTQCFAWNVLCAYLSLVEHARELKTHWDFVFYGWQHESVWSLNSLGNVEGSYFFQVKKLN